MSMYKFYNFYSTIVDKLFTFYHIAKSLCFPRLPEGHKLKSISEYRSTVIRYDLLAFFRNNNSTYGFGRVESFFRWKLSKWIFNNLYKHP